MIKKKLTYEASQDCSRSNVGVAFGVCGNVNLFNNKLKFLIEKPLLGPANCMY